MDKSVVYKMKYLKQLYAIHVSIFKQTQVFNILNPENRPFHMQGYNFDKIKYSTYEVG